MSLSRGLIHVQIVIILSAYILSVDGAPPVRNYFRDVSDSEQYVLSGQEDSRENSDRSYENEVETDELPSIYLVSEYK